MRSSVRQTVESGGLQIAVYEWPGKGRPLLFAHATGFHAHCWDQVIAGFAERRCIAIDMPGHGRSENPQEINDSLIYAQCVVDVIDALKLTDILGIGHSMGGHSLSHAYLQRPKCFAGLVLIDPVMSDPELPNMLAALDPLDFPVARRRNSFDSAQAMREQLQGKMPFKTWDAQVLRDYCEHGLVKTPDGKGFELACPPLLEAQTYVRFGPHLGREDLSQISIPVEVIRARPMEALSGNLDFQGSPTWPELAGLLPQGRDQLHAELSHFIPMEEPALTIELISEAEERLSPHKP